MAVLLALRFALELSLLAAFAVGGWRLGAGFTAWALAIALPLGCALVWGLLLSPKARLSLPLVPRLVVELTLFASAAALLWVADLPTFAVALVVGEVVVLALLLALGQRLGRDQLQTID